jgi:hypothetical protein
MFKKILVPLDGSELAAQILPQVEELGCWLSRCRSAKKEHMDRIATDNSEMPA